MEGGTITNITVMSRSDCICYCNKEHDNEAIIISISDPYMVYSSKPKRTRKNGVISVLSLEFCDADKPGRDVYGRETEVTDLMTDDDAKKVASFVKSYPNTDIIVHCDAGISRSAGVAAAIMKWSTDDDTPIFKSWRYYPNMWAYRKTLNALMEE